MEWTESLDTRANKPLENKALTRQTVLAVDDDESVRQLLSAAIRHLGHKSVTAVDGLDALEKLEKRPFDIVIADLNMPRMDGMELIKRIVADFEEIDVIAITGAHSRYRYTDIINLGARDFISKPFSINELEARIDRIVRERNLRLELKKLSIHDGLTGLHNRRYFDENLKNEAIRALRQGYGLFFLFMDIDKFKAYNDKHGHQQGDHLLKQLAGVILRHTRKAVDTAYRYGGDEFAVLLPYVSHEQALMVAERLRSKYSQTRCEFTSLSIGVAELKAALDTLDDDLNLLVERADQALYYAKSAGGNQVLGDWQLQTPSSASGLN